MLRRAQRWHNATMPAKAPATSSEAVHGFAGTRPGILDHAWSRSMTRVHPNWRDDGEYCIRSACGAKGPERVRGKDCASIARRIRRAVNAIFRIRRTKGDETHFFCRTCRRCSERRVVLNGEFNWWVAGDAEIWHESSGVFVRNPDGRFLFFRRTIYPAGTPRLFQDHDVSPRMVNGRSMERPAHRVASVTSVRPAIRSAPIARLRRAAMTLGPFRVLTLDLSS